MVASARQPLLELTIDVPSDSASARRDDRLQMKMGGDAGMIQTRAAAETHSNTATTEEMSEDVLRVTLLSLEGIHLSPATCSNDENDTCTTNTNNNTDESKLIAVPSTTILPTMRVNAWAGFRSSFPPQSTNVPSSHYSSLFQREGNLLAVESDDVKPVHAVQKDGVNEYYSGVANWQMQTRRTGGASNAQENEVIPVHHLVIQLPPALSADTSNDEVPQSLSPLLPDIVEFHICVVCTTVEPEASARDVEESWKTSSNTQSPEWNGIKIRQKNKVWDNAMEEEHWYRNDKGVTFDEDNDTDVIDDREQQICRGVAHLKIQPLSGSSYDYPGGEILRLPIRVVESATKSTGSSNVESEELVKLESNALLLIRVERVKIETKAATKLSITHQRHYIESDRREDVASVIPNSECDNKELFRTKSASSTTRKILQIATPTNGFNKIQQALESSNLFRAKQKQQREEKKDAVLHLEKDEDDGSECAVNQSAVTNERHVIVGDYTKSTSMREQPADDDKKESAIEECAVVEDDDIRMISTLGQRIQESPDVAISPPKSMLQKIREKLRCGSLSDLGDVVHNVARAGHHCDEDHVGMYVMDSLSLTSSIATADIT